MADFLFAFGWVLGVMVGVPVAVCVMAQAGRSITVHYHYHEHEHRIVSECRPQVMAVLPPVQTTRLLEVRHGMVR